MYTAFLRLRFYTAKMLALRSMDVPSMFFLFLLFCHSRFLGNSKEEKTKKHGQDAHAT